MKPTLETFFGAQAVMALRAVSTEELKRLWDEYDGANEPGGFEGEHIHAELNARGEGNYCAV